MRFSTQKGLSVHSSVLKVISNRHGPRRLLQDLKLLDLDQVSLFVLKHSVSRKFLLALKLE